MKPDHIWPINECQQVLEQIEQILTAKVDSSNGDAIAQTIGDLIAFYPSSSDVVSSLKWHQETAYRKEFEHIANYLKQGKGKAETAPLQVPSILKDYIKSRTADTQALLVKAERINAAITHSIEGLRSILSKLKEERKISSYQQHI